LAEKTPPRKDGGGISIDADLVDRIAATSR
jgi:hypothetical protein